MSKREKTVPELWLEQAALGELSDASRLALEARIEPDELSRQRTALQQANEQTLRELPSHRLVDAIKRRAQRAKRQDRTHQWMSVAGSAATALSLAALLVVVYDDYSQVPPSADRGEHGLEETRIKGLSPHLVVYRKRGDVVERLADGAKAHAGDELQLAYVAARRAHGVVVSIDGAGAVTMHLSLSGSSAALSMPRETLLAESYRLDAAPAFERFFLVTSGHVFDALQVERAARDLAADRTHARSGVLSLPAGLQQTAFTVIKVQP
jgi:hypothetical protein